MLKEYKPLLDIIEILSDPILQEKYKENSGLHLGSLLEPNVHKKSKLK